MIALIIGIICILFTVWAILPFPFPMGLGWGEQIIEFLKGGGPILSLLIGIIAFFIGIADIRDKIEEKKELKEEKEKAKG
jgi:UDP-N-acetylmuramyl pentapeptide phosphotransferase/UDP-N-acetylglucosamine-1-phosphate transferase